MKSQKFKELINTNSNGLYIGTGNPLADILIIGKEPAIDSIANEAQYTREIKNNAADWKFNLTNNIQEKQIASWFQPGNEYNPLHPYKGQNNKIEVKRNNRSAGTSRTFYNYQKLIDAIYNNKYKSATVNFHNSSFITELNEATALYSNQVNKESRELSIQKRLCFVKEDFYQDFPVVIVAVGHYVRNFNINLEDLFAVNYDIKKGIIPISSSNYINLHYDNIDNPQKLVIHTNQLSINISNELIYKMAKIIRDFLAKRKNIVD